MATLSLQNFATLVRNTGAAVQGACKQLLNLTPGSVLLSIIEAFSGVGLWLQFLIVQVWLGCRLATSIGSDVDSFVNDFDMKRLGSSPATGVVTLSRNTPDYTSLIPPYFNADGSTNPNGAQVLTADGTLTFGVISDAGNSYWNVSASAYILPSGTTSFNVTVKAITAGSTGNIATGSINQISSSIVGIDTVTNAQPFDDGADAESDAAVKSRFQNYINTRARATPAAVAYAVSSVQPGLLFSLAENQDAHGNYLPGNFVLTVDDGSGTPPASLISTIYAAVDAVRPVGSTFSVLPPTDVEVTVSLTITVGPNGNKSSLIGAVQTAIIDYIDTLGIGAILPITRVSQIAYAADPNITNVSGVLLNGATLDITPPATGVVKASSVAVN